MNSCSVYTLEMETTGEVGAFRLFLLQQEEKHHAKIQA